MSTSDQILLNRIRTPDGTVLTSWSRHDFKTYEDANGHTYMVDGGLDYIRRFIVEQAPPEELSVSLDIGNHDSNRQAFHWGTYGIGGGETLRHIALEDMDSSHIHAIIKTQKHISQWVKDLMEEEINWRGELALLAEEES